MKEVITERLVCLDVKANTKEVVIGQLANLIYEDDRIDDLKGYIDSVISREELTSTGIGFGIAIPHGKCKHVKQTTIAFGRIPKGMDWNSLDNQPVQSIILLAIPEANSGDEHLRLLASISRKLIHEEFRNTLSNCNDINEISTLLNTCV
ncbi:MAG: PTS sugar transporter subunit IIA [Coprobacillaceae bacterium]